MLPQQGASRIADAHFLSEATAAHSKGYVFLWLTSALITQALTGGFVSWGTVFLVIPGVYIARFLGWLGFAGRVRSLVLLQPDAGEPRLPAKIAALLWSVFDFALPVFAGSYYAEFVV
jgi:hypothetical protein